MELTQERNNLINCINDAKREFIKLKFVELKRKFALLIDKEILESQKGHIEITLFDEILIQHIKKLINGGEKDPFLPYLYNVFDDKINSFSIDNIDVLEESKIMNCNNFMNTMAHNIIYGIIKELVSLENDLSKKRNTNGDIEISKEDYVEIVDQVNEIMHNDVDEKYAKDIDTLLTHYYSKLFISLKGDNVGDYLSKHKNDHYVKTIKRYNGAVERHYIKSKIEEIKKFFELCKYDFELTYTVNKLELVANEFKQLKDAYEEYKDEFKQLKDAYEKHKNEYEQAKDSYEKVVYEKYKVIYEKHKDEYKQAVDFKQLEAVNEKYKNEYEQAKDKEAEDVYEKHKDKFYQVEYDFEQVKLRYERYKDEFEPIKDIYEEYKKKFEQLKDAYEKYKDTINKDIESNINIVLNEIPDLKFNKLIRCIKDNNKDELINETLIYLFNDLLNNNSDVEKHITMAICIYEAACSIINKCQEES